MPIISKFPILIVLVITRFNFKKKGNENYMALYVFYYHYGRSIISYSHWNNTLFPRNGSMYTGDLSFWGLV